MENYDDWVNNEYSLWESALTDLMVSDETFNNFKAHPQVKRMLGVSDLFQPFADKLKTVSVPWKTMENIDQIGNPTNVIDVDSYKISGVCLRYIYYADKVLNIIANQENIKIVEIGAGYGGFCSILHALAKHRKIKIAKYGIFDLPTVQYFQDQYLEKTIKKSKFGLQDIFFLDPENLELFDGNYNFCLSFYSLGELASVVKQKYLEHVISKIPHGFIIWNPHFEKDIEGQKTLKQIKPEISINAENPLTGAYNLELVF